jgi:hypothetical protein
VKKIVIVLGMHRSGTSVFTGILNKMGLPLGENLMKPTKDNPKGYFENMDFYHFNEMVLRECNSSWYDVSNLTEEKILKEEYKNILKSIIKKYNNYDIFGVKDPRICVLLPLYEKVCGELGIKIEYVLITRDKESIINSINKRDGYSKEIVSKLIDSYLTIPFEKKTTLKLSYEDIIDNPNTTIKIILDSLPYLQNNDDVYNFIDKNLKRN